MITSAAKQQLAKMPAPVKQFAKRALLLLLSWILVYHVVLKPYRIPDRLLSNATGIATAQLLTIGYAPAGMIENRGWACVTIGGTSVIRIGDPCNALDLFVLYVGFLLCIPTTRMRTALFAVSGVAAIFCLNVIRCYTLTWLALNKYEWLDFAHKYAFTAIVYAFIFYGWILYTRNYEHKTA